MVPPYTSRKPSFHGTKLRAPLMELPQPPAPIPTISSGPGGFARVHVQGKINKIELDVPHLDQRLICRGGGQRGVERTQRTRAEPTDTDADGAVSRLINPVK
jgi:hypothetical protein